MARRRRSPSRPSGDLTVYVDKRELVTLMTLGAHPEWLVLGYLRNQRLVERRAVESVTVDWEVGGAAVKTRTGIDRIEERTAHRVVTTGCGQGSVFGDLMDEVEAVALPEARITQSQLYGIVNAIRLQETHVQIRRVGARLRAVSRRADAAVRRGRGPPQRHRHHCRLDVAAG